ncbi:MAG: hypothetical protein IT232_04765 [Flavobacteriales bacterium]|nr:hypothetical protein [Flavobacteriales bacterium]
MLFLIQLTSFAQSVIVSAQPDTNKILIGEQIQVKLNVQYRVDNGKQLQIQFPNLADTLIEKVEIVSKSTIDTVIPDKADPYFFIQEQIISITSFDSGIYSIPPFQFIVNSDTLTTNSFLVEVNTLEVDTTKAIFDIKAPISEPFSLLDWIKENWWWLVAILVLGVLIYIAVRYFKNRKLVKVPEKLAPEIPYHIIALQKLEQLKSEQLWQNGKTKQYHSIISEVIREYLERRYQINALEETTHEIMHRLRLQTIPAEQMNKLNQLLTLADLVKFAKEQPLPHENEQSLTHAISFIETTKIVMNSANNA